MPRPFVLCVCLFLGLCPLYLSGQSLSSLPIDSLSHRANTASIHTPRQTESLITRSLGVSLPMLAMALPYNLTNRYVRGLRSEHLPRFRHHYDDYLQFAPLATQLGMFALGVRGQSESWGQILTADALAITLMMSSVTLGKQLTRIERPDGSARNSFPSGHTAMAFASATLLHLEYGERYPFISPLAYLTAGAVGIGRMLNNRHWVGDVLSGLNVGILSGELAYYLSGLIHGKHYSYREPESLFPKTDLRLSLPWFVGVGQVGSYRSGGRAMGLRWAYSKRGYFVEGEVASEYYQPSGEAPQRSGHSDYRLSLSWGKSWALPAKLSLDLSAGVAWSKGSLLYPTAQLSPRWSFSSRLATRVFASYALAPAVSLGQGTSIPRQRWHIGSALELRL